MTRKQRIMPIQHRTSGGKFSSLHVTTLRPQKNPFKEFATNIEHHDYQYTRYWMNMGVRFNQNNPTLNFFEFKDSCFKVQNTLKTVATILDFPDYYNSNEFKQLLLISRTNLKPWVKQFGFFSVIRDLLLLFTTNNYNEFAQTLYRIPRDVLQHCLVGALSRYIEFRTPERKLFLSKATCLNKQNAATNLINALVQPIDGHSLDTALTQFSQQDQTALQGPGMLNYLYATALQRVQNQSDFPAECQGFIPREKQPSNRMITTPSPR